ncbi:MAG: YedE family putative selenium transporter [Coriobacteriia bacterium]|nr:YedE family putative selenium transporter [Coriobacteriia bacterium]
MKKEKPSGGQARFFGRILDRFQVLALVATGVLIAILAVALTQLGNPGNMGLCGACFIRDLSGALGLHHNALLQYARPEVMGIVLGAVAVALIAREFKAQGATAPLSRFVLGLTMMIGALIFLGCPVRMLLRIAGGDLNAIIGLAGFICGVALGVVFLKKGFSLGRTRVESATEGVALPAAALMLLAIAVFVPSLLLFSTEGPGSMHAPLWAALIAGLAVGSASLLSRFCIVGAFRDSILLKKITPTMMGVMALLVAATTANLITGSFHLSFANQPVAHTQAFWNFAGLALVGLAAVLASGCPMRQLVLVGSGSSDAALTILGMMAGAALAHNFQIAATPAGVTAHGAAGFALAAFATVAIALAYTIKRKNERLLAAVSPSRAVPQKEAGP